MSLTDHLLIEIGTEELPPKSIQKFAQAFANSVQEQLQQLSIAFEQVDAFATPRRIAIRVNDLMLKQPDTQQQRLGPAVAAAIKDGKPTPAATGFARSCGVTFEELEHIATDKGARLGYEVKTQGLPTKNFIEDIVNQAINKFPIPKAMRWGNSDETFSRPIHWIVALLGSETLPITVKGLVASNVSYGHRFHAPEAMMLTSPTAYEEQLEKAFVIASFEKRQAIIQQQVAAIAKEKNVTIVTEPDLLDEVTALVEWPVALLGSFDAEFLEVPRECVVSSMAEHQKYFHVTDAKGELQPLFVTVANIESKDPQAIIDGNEKVVRPRLADAKFFFTSDQKTSLEARLEKLKNIVFQAKLGTLYDKTERLQKLAITLAEQFKHTTAANVETLQRAALLSRCDLVTDMVGEFPELQGIMGAYYAKAQNETAAVAEALEDVYRPRFAADALPRSLESSVLAIADRLDTLVGIFGIKQAPTGAKDPFGLRRAALGIIRISIENQLEFSTRVLLKAAIAAFPDKTLHGETVDEAYQFIHSRLKGYFQEQGFDTRVINAVIGISPDSLLDAFLRVQAVQDFLKLDSAKSLSNATKRVNNILRKEGKAAAQTIDNTLLESDVERELVEAIAKTQGSIDKAFQDKDYASALLNLSQMESAIANFFDHVMVMAEDKKVKANRLAILSSLQPLLTKVADISQLATA